MKTYGNCNPLEHRRTTPAPVEIMDEIERDWESLIVVNRDKWQSLRTALERQADWIAYQDQKHTECAEELAQKDARIARLTKMLSDAEDTIAKVAMMDDDFANTRILQIRHTLNESHAQSAARLKAETLREVSELFSGIDHPATEEEDVLSVQRVVSVLLNEADRIERAKHKEQPNE